jgi:hypothetical protein
MLAFEMNERGLDSDGTPRSQKLGAAREGGE